MSLTQNQKDKQKNGFNKLNRYAESWVEFIKAAFRELSLRKSRSFLTMLGIIIGVAAVISVMAVGASAQKLLLSQVRALGSNLVGVLPGASEGAPAAMFGINVTTLKRGDAKAIRKLPHIEAVCPYVMTKKTVTFFNESQTYDIKGIADSYTDVEDTSIEKGRFFRRSETSDLSRVAVLGSEIADELFEGSDPIGRKIKIGQVSFKVIGVMKERGTALFQNQDKQIFLPLKTAQKTLLGIDHLSVIRAKVESSQYIDSTINRIEELLRFRHNIKNPEKDDFSVRSTAQATDILSNITKAIEVFLASVASISLLVGGIGIMNIMFVSVNERTREVGLRKALGARRKDIILQFLTESALLTLIGGIIGILVGIGVSYLIAIGVQQFGYNWQFIIPPFAIALSVLMAVLVGITFSLWPAYKASKLNPIEALKYE